MAAQGFTDEQIAKTLGIAVSTIRTQWVRLKQKLNTSSRTHAVALVLASRHRVEMEELEERLKDTNEDA